MKEFPGDSSRRHLKFESPGDYGGGGGRHPEAKRFFYLVVDSVKQTNLSPDHVTSFFRAGVNSGSEYIFVYIDIASDHRLLNDMMRLTGGHEFFSEVRKNTPVFLISSRAIPDLTDVKLIETFPIADYEKDVDAIYKSMGLHNRNTRKAAISFFRRINGYNVNEVISDMLDHLERQQPLKGL